MAIPEGRVPDGGVEEACRRSHELGLASCRVKQAGEREAVYRNQATESMFYGSWLALTETRPELKCAIREVGYWRRITSSVAELDEDRVKVPRRESRYFEILRSRRNQNRGVAQPG